MNPRKLVLNFEFWEAAAPANFGKTHPHAAIRPSTEQLNTHNKPGAQQLFSQ
jgi:hypothetical protein